MIAMGPSIKPDSSTQVVPVISPFPFSANHPAKTGSDGFEPRGKIVVMPVRTGPFPIISGPSPEIRVVCPTKTSSTSVMALLGPVMPSKGIPRSLARGPFCPATMDGIVNVHNKIKAVVSSSIPVLQFFMADP